MPEIERWGESFRVADRGVPLMALMRFAQIAKRGTDSNDMDGLAAIRDLLDAVIHSEDLPRFDRVADENEADGDDLMSVAMEGIKVIAERPTSRPSDSSDGSSTTSESSADGYSSPVTRLEAKGRPDLALLVSRAQQSRASA